MIVMVLVAVCPPFLNLNVPMSFRLSLSLFFCLCLFLAFLHDSFRDSYWCFAEQ